MWKHEKIAALIASVVKFARSTIVNVARKVSDSPQKENGIPAF